MVRIVLEAGQVHLEGEKEREREGQREGEKQREQGRENIGILPKVKSEKITELRCGSNQWLQNGFLEPCPQRPVS